MRCVRAADRPPTPCAHGTRTRTRTRNPDAHDVLTPGGMGQEWSRVEEAAAGRLIIAADYTHPSVAVKNALFYRSKNVPFVMGTTGYDIDECKLAIGDELYAVLAPNMGAHTACGWLVRSCARQCRFTGSRLCINPQFAVFTPVLPAVWAPWPGKPIVLFQAMLKHAAEVYPGALSGFELSVVESHQKGKADTSGTAKAVVASLAELTAAPFGLVTQPFCCLVGAGAAIHIASRVGSEQID
jgi:dihydrodipicolinate reductase